VRQQQQAALQAVQMHQQQQIHAAAQLAARQHVQQMQNIHVCDIKLVINIEKLIKI
jgi:hypothetical protein